jgi:hypothetical protein
MPAVSLDCRRSRELTAKADYSRLTLALLVALDLADHAHHSMATDDLALLTARFY